MDTTIITGERRLSVEKWARKNRIDTAFAGNLSKALRNPEEVTYLLSSMTEDFSVLAGKGKKEVRNALLRVQINCSINSEADPIKVSKQHVVAHILEKLFFGSNVLFMEEIEEIEEKPKKRKRKKC